MTHKLLRIRQLNDEARNFPATGTIFVTSSLAAMPTDDLAAILQRVQTFDDFDPENDPYGEHDFGAFDYQAHRIFWKIDYYDLRMRFASPDPADPGVTKRIITVMLATEY